MVSLTFTPLLLTSLSLFHTVLAHPFDRLFNPPPHSLVARQNAFTLFSSIDSAVQHSIRRPTVEGLDDIVQFITTQATILQIDPIIVLGSLAEESSGESEAPAAMVVPGAESSSIPNSSSGSTAQSSFALSASSSSASTHSPGTSSSLLTPAKSSSSAALRSQGPSSQSAQSSKAAPTSKPPTSQLSTFFHVPSSSAASSSAASASLSTKARRDKVTRQNDSAQQIIAEATKAAQDVVQLGRHLRNEKMLVELWLEIVDGFLQLGELVDPYVPSLADKVEAVFKPATG